MHQGYSGRELFELGNRLLMSHRTAEALSAFENASRLEPNQPAIPANMGIVLAEMGRIEDARLAYDKAISLEKSYHAPYELRKTLLQPVIFDSKDQVVAERQRLNKALKKFRKAKNRIKDPQNEVGTPAFFLAYQGQNNRETQVAIAETLAEACPSLRYKAEIRKHPARSKIRVGFFSAHFYEHTVGRVNLGLIKHLPRDQFEVIVIRPSGQKDEVTDQIHAAADSHLIVSPNLVEAREEIGLAELDILLYADIGMEPLSYYLAFSRLAPVQAALWGHPDTTGIKNIDYYVSTKQFEPENGQEAYSERLIQLPRHYMCLDLPPDPVRKLPKSDFLAKEDQNVYFCPQSLFKFHPDTDQVFDHILKQDPKGLICLPNGSEPYWSLRLGKRFAKSCPETHDRIRFIPRVHPDQFRNALYSADVVLDPIHFTGGYTSYLSMSVASPVVTMRGNFLPGRMTCGLYQQMGMSDRISTSSEQYAANAVRLANDSGWKKDHVEEIKDARSEIFNDRLTVTQFSEFLSAAYEAANKNELVQMI